MGIELGRISGPLLTANLLRHGVPLAFEDDLLYIDVTTGRIGIKSDAPTRTLLINGSSQTTNLIVDTQADIADLTLVSNKIQNAAGAIYIRPNQLLDPTVALKELRTSELAFTQQSIATLVANDNIELSPNGTGRVIFNTSKVNVTGNLHATGNITWDGTITLGNSANDSVDFNSDLSSNLVSSNESNLGSADKNWKTLYSVNVNATEITTPSLIVNDIDPLTTQGNVLYVSINGSDTNNGDHLHSTFRTVKHALSVSQAGDEVVIFPGIYEEAFPLTVPQGVSVRGAGIRSVTIVPTLATNDQDAFLLNGETTVSFLTVKDFFFNSANNTGYAFKFAPNMKVVSRSPYMFNLTVITKGSVVSAEDPTGFLQGDAGGGVYLDGSVVHPDSKEATGLFFAVTFICPNQDGLTATNGVRVEWLNSFTYFAKRGLYLTRGTLGFASLGVKFGAELRSINSANVYGTYGAVADSADTLGYLIGHNFGYIGSGGDSTNDRGLCVQANEIVATNSGILYFDSMDHKGDYRVGDIFYVNQETGQVSFNAQSIDFTATGNIILESSTGITIIDAPAVQVTNLRIYDNTIESLIGHVNWAAASGSTYLNTNVFVTGLIDITGDVFVDGNVYLGNDPLDTVAIAPLLTQSVNPKLGSTYDLGKLGIDPKIWDVAYLTTFDIDNVIQVTNNTVTVLSTDIDLELVAAGTGKIYVSSTDVVVDNSLTVNNNLTINGETSVQDLTSVGIVTLVGNIDQTGNTDIIGAFKNNNINITGASSYFEVPSINILTNIISATFLDDNLEFTANGIGGVIIDNKLKITDDTISNVWTGATTDSQRSIIFSPNGTGNLVIDSVRALTIPVGTPTLTTTGQIRQNSTTGLYEGYLSTGPVSFNDLYDSNKDTYITAELTTGANDNTLRFATAGVVRASINATALLSATLKVDNLNFNSNILSNTLSNDDMLVLVNGTGAVNINQVLVKPDQIINTTNGAITLSSTGIGYVKFGGTGAVIFPYGPTEDRRLTPELGEIRYNSTVDYMEVFDGTAWIPAVGTLGAAPLDEVLDILDIYSLILG